MIKPIQGQPAPQQPQPISQTKSKKSTDEVSNTDAMRKNADTVKQMQAKGRFILGAGEPAAFDTNLKNPEEAKLAGKVFNRAIGS